MELTQSPWTVSTVNGRMKATCTVTATTSANDSYTLKTPKELDPTKPWTLFLIASAALDGTTIPVDLWIGYSDNFALSGDGSSVTATDGAEYMTIVDAIPASAGAWAIFFDPNLAQAEDTTISGLGMKVRPPVAPYYAFNLDMSSTANAATATWVIIQ